MIVFTGEGKCEVNSRLFLSASISSRNKKFCLCRGDVGVYIRACLTRLSRGRDRIRYNELKQENWTSRWFHTNHFITAYCFRRDLLHLKVDISSILNNIYHVLEASFRGDSCRFISVSVKRGDRDRAGRERTLYILLILEKHIVSLLLGLYRNKSRPFEVSNDTLLLSVKSNLTEYF